MVRYRQTIVGAGWALLQPLLLMVVFTVFFGLLGRLPSAGLPYPVFFFLGLMPWHMVSKILNEGSASVVANRPLVTRVYFPRSYFPASVALASLVDLALSVVPLVVLLVLFGIVPGVEVIFAPLLIVPAWLTALGVAIWLSALNVRYRDITQLLPFFTQVWMFGSPIIYPSTIVPEPYRWVYFLNPIAGVIESLRHLVAHAPAPPAYAIPLGLLVAICVLLTGYLYFRHSEPTFADVV